MTSSWECTSCKTFNAATDAECICCQRPQPAEPAVPAETARHAPSRTAILPPPREEVPLRRTAPIPDEIFLPPRSTGYRPGPAAPPSPPPRRPSPPAPPVVPRPARRSGRLKAAVVAACVLATLYLGAGNWETVQRFFGEHLRTNPAPAGTCPAKVARSISGDGPVNLVAAYRTSQHDVIICRTGTSRFYYHGEVTGNPGSAMDLPARKTAKGYLAVNGSYTYEVRGRRIIVSRSGQVIGDYRGRPFKP